PNRAAKIVVSTDASRWRRLICPVPKRLVIMRGFQHGRELAPGALEQLRPGDIEPVRPIVQTWPGEDGIIAPGDSPSSGILPEFLFFIRLSPVNVNCIVRK